MSTSRREFLKISGITSSLCLFPSLFKKCGKKRRKPNIVLVLADDMGYGDLSCYGQKHFSTPNIDKLAKNGMKFTQHYAGSTVCAPSRCVLLTGKHTGHAYVRGNKQAEPSGQLPLPAGETTFAEILQKNGYKTGCFGKWGLGTNENIGDPQNHGFDTFVGYYDQVRAHNAFPEFIYKNGKKIHLDNEVKYMPEDHWSEGLGSYSTEKNEYARDVVFKEAVKFLEDNRDNPFLLYFPTTIPHDNGEALEGAKNEVPYIKEEFKNKNWSKEQKQYATVNTILDDYVGKLTDKIKELGLERETIFIFTSDNGPTTHPWNKKFDSNGPLRGYKRDLYEGGIRVPLLVKWPGNIKKHSISEHVSAFWDFFPTICEIAGVDKDYETDGISFLPTLTGKKQEQHEYLYWEFHFWKPSRQAIRFGKWKAVKNSSESAIELYNLDQDISEAKNIAEENPAIVEKASSLMNKARDESDLWQLKS